MRNTKKLLLILLAILLMGITSWVISFVYNNTVRFPGDAAVSIHWEDNTVLSDKQFTQTLSREEAEQVIRLLNGYSYEVWGDGAGCPLGEDCTVTIGGTVFYMATDDCPVMEHAETGRIFEMKYEHMTALIALFQKYGATTL